MKNKYNILGVIAIVIWGLSAGFTRTLGESLGLFTSGALVNILAGILICVVMRVKYGNWGSMKAVPAKYFLVCGSLYVTYVLTSYISTISTANRQQVLSVVIIKFMWPILTLLLTIPLLKQRPSRWIWASILLSIIGLVLVNVGDEREEVLSSGLSFSISIPMILGFLSAVSWALFSIYTRKLLSQTNQNFDYVGYFILIVGIIMGIVAIFREEPHRFGAQQFGELLFQIVLTSCVANLFWNKSILKGNITLVVTLSNLLPIISVLGTALILQENITTPIIMGSALISISTFWSRWCFDHGSSGGAAKEKPHE